MATRPPGWLWGEIPQEDLCLFEDTTVVMFFLRELRPPPIEMPDAPDDLEGAIVLNFPPLGPLAET